MNQNQEQNKATQASNQQQTTGNETSTENSTSSSTQTRTSEQKAAEKFYGKKESDQAAADTDAQANDSSGADQSGDSTESSSTGEAAGSEEVKADADKANEQEGSERVVPETYELKLPENSLLKESVIEKVAAFAKEQGLTQKEAQAVLEHENETLKAYKAEEDKFVNEVKGQWKKETLADPEIGGAKAKENSEYAFRVFEKFGSPKFKQLLESTGFGNHPEVVRVFSKLGRQLFQPAKVIGAGGGTNGPGKGKSAEEKFYGKNSSAK